ncbi:MAG: iron-containing redox enzyme family protein [Elusimicrobia bacterium]|nr:iron-containing redox enzyme family protein [Elusimicrobiota bacterium]
MNLLQESPAFFSSLENEISTHPAVHHPFLKRFSHESLGLSQIRAFGLQHYQLVSVFTTYMTHLTARLSPERTSLLRGVFEDEFGQYTLFRSHVHLYRNFLKALGLRDEDWGRVPHRTETTAFIRGHLQLTREGPILKALGAIGPGHEHSIPLMFQHLLRGLRQSTLLREKDLEYFTMHIEEDKEHAVAFKTLISALATTPRDRAQVEEGVAYSLEMRHSFWTGCQNLVFGGEPS